MLHLEDFGRALIKRTELIFIGSKCRVGNKELLCLPYVHGFEVISDIIRHQMIEPNDEL